MSKPYLIAPSILSADFARLGEEVENVLQAGADVVHFDVMDNHYVPNLTFGAGVCKALKNYGITAPIDVHLMVKPVDRMIGDFLEAGADIITFHPEASEHIDRSLQLIKSGGAKAGLVFNPATPLHYLDYVLDNFTDAELLSFMEAYLREVFICSNFELYNSLSDVLFTTDIITKKNDGMHIILVTLKKNDYPIIVSQQQLSIPTPIQSIM